MDELSKFCDSLRDIIGNTKNLNIPQARQVVKEINEFLYTYYDGIGTTEFGNVDLSYFSDFHKYWEEHHKEILDCHIDDIQCERVADALHEVFVVTEGKAFSELYDTCNLSPQEICQVRFLTANQDFRGSRDFSQLAKIYKQDPASFDIDNIISDPQQFIKHLGLSNLSQNDKRINYAREIARFVKNRGCQEPYALYNLYKRDIYALRKDIIGSQGAGYGNKKTDMLLRDMVVLGVWDNPRNFDKIDVASDINTIKVALRTGIITTAIPLVSSFLDIFSYQYGYIDAMNAAAWRRVWEYWSKKYPNECVLSPCLIDYFVYGVVGKQFCKEILHIFKCIKYPHCFYWNSARNTTCQLCYHNGEKGVKAVHQSASLPCVTPHGRVSILETKFVQSLPQGHKLEQCPFANICSRNKYLEPPKSISIFGRTGWQTAYTKKGNGGGGLMA